jgi:hypothetical protein
LAILRRVTQHARTDARLSRGDGGDGVPTRGVGPRACLDTITLADDGDFHADERASTDRVRDLSGDSTGLRMRSASGQKRRYDEWQPTGSLAMQHRSPLSRSR